MSHQFVVLNSNVNIWERLLVTIVQISHFDPTVHQTQRNLLIFLLIIIYFVIIVDSSSFIHHVSVGLFEPQTDIDYAKDDEPNVKNPHTYESEPSQVIKHSDVHRNSIRVIENYLLKDKCVSKYCNKHNEGDKLQTESKDVSPASVVGLCDTETNYLQELEKDQNACFPLRRTIEER